MILPFPAAAGQRPQHLQYAYLFVSLSCFRSASSIPRAERSYIEYSGAYNQRDGRDHSLRRELFSAKGSRPRPHIGGDGHSGYDKKRMG